MSRKITFMLLAAVFILTLLPMTALAAPGDSGTTADGFIWEEQADGTVWITGYSGGAAANIPGSINGLTVTQIGDGAFSSNTTITSVTIPDSVTTLQEFAFSDCTNLQTVTFGSGLTTIESNVFNECTTLGSIALPNSVTSIGDNVFYGCTGLTSVTLSSQITLIPDFAFHETAITSITIPDSVQSIGVYAFAHSDIQSITTPESCTSIGQEAFTECSSLTTASLRHVETIGSMSFYNCTSLTDLKLSDELETISDNAFYNCRFSSLVLPESLQNAAFRSFGDNTALTSVTIKGSPTISQQAFDGCTNLSKAYIISMDAVFGLYSFFETAVEVASPASNGIYGFAGSTAQTYANNNSINFHPSVLVSFDEGKGSAVGDQFITVNSTATEPSDPSRSHYIFGGWYTTAGFDTEYDFSVPVGANITLFAKWTGEPCSVTFSSNGGSTVSAQTVAYGDKVIEPGDPTRDHHVFGGWYTDAALTDEWDFDNDTVTGNTTLYAGWTGEPCNITFNVNGGSTVSAQTVAYGDKVTKPTDPTRVNHLFGGWYADAALTDAWDFDNDTVTGNTALYAKWTELKLSSSVAGGKIYTGGRIMLTPNIDGGTWDWDEEYFSATFNSPATFTALKAGTSTITYTVGGVSIGYEVTITASELPSTGQDEIWIWILGGAAVLALAGGFAMKRVFSK